MKIYKSREGSHNMECCCYGEVQRGLRARRQCLLGKDSVVEDPSEKKVCLLDSHSTTRINVHVWVSESIANPTVSN